MLKVFEQNIFKIYTKEVPDWIVLGCTLCLKTKCWHRHVALQIWCGRYEPEVII